MEVLIVGAGTMGRWFGRTLAEWAEPAPSLAFADADPGSARSAADAVGGRSVPVDGDESFRVVCLAVPIPAVADAVAAQAPRTEAAICDLAGVMAPAVEAQREYAPDAERISYHPLFAPGNAPGTVAAVPDRPGETTRWIDDALRAAGNRVFETTAAEHDRAMGTVQAGAHAAVLSFALAADRVPEAFSTPVFEGMVELVETVAGGDPRVYADVQAAFDGADEVAAAAERIAEADRESFAELYRSASVPLASDDGIGSAGDAPDSPGDGIGSAGDAPDSNSERGGDRR